MASCIEYPSHMLPFGFALLRTIFFKTFIYHSIGYIHLVLIGPQCSSSCSRCIRRCIEILNIVGENSHSNKQRTSTTSSLKLSKFEGSNTCILILFNIRPNLIIANLGPFCKLDITAIGKISSIMT